MSWPSDSPSIASRHARRLAARRGVLAIAAAILGSMLIMAGAAAAEAQKAQPAAVLPGGNSKEPINIDAAKLDYFDKEQKLVYTGNVVATQGPSKLKASVLVLYLTQKDAKAQSGVPSSSSELRRMEATGPVTVISKDQVGTGDSGIYEKAENKVYLIGNVTLTQGPNVTKGDKLIYDLTTSQAVVTGRVKSMFIPSGGAHEGAGEGAAGASGKKSSGKTP
ncbi:LptA/OstA family protein [Methylocella tundrae]|uniref:Organic solvent tolerance protein OstA n=1 Tax=Methylocella tundrae TaxID=227605 RepID=A0A4U8YTR4_METTU|nr:LptA/OstA family protein [Methylocella tundrae]VFU07106.1 Organic solvent tolerance protein OstA [Methylocella tundrae]